jgi:hypothetical protein
MLFKTFSTVISRRHMRVDRAPLTAPSPEALVTKKS